MELGGFLQMGSMLFKMFGMKMAKHALHGNGRRAPLIDVGLGFALLRDRRVPVAKKGLALLLGGLAIAGLIALEAPVEMLIGLLLNAPGLGMDLLVDGIEMLAGPVLIASLLLTHMAPKEIVEQVRGERQGVLLR